VVYEDRRPEALDEVTKQVAASLRLVPEEVALCSGDKVVDTIAEVGEELVAIVQPLTGLEEVLHYAKQCMELPERLRSLCEERRFMLAVVRRYRGGMRYASAALRADAAFILACTAIECYTLFFASDTLRGDRDFMMTAVRQEGMALCYEAV